MSLFLSGLNDWKKKETNQTSIYRDSLKDTFRSEVEKTSIKEKIDLKNDLIERIDIQIEKEKKRITGMNSIGV